MSDKVKKVIYLSPEIDKILWEMYKIKKDRNEHPTFSNITEEALLYLYKKNDNP